MHMEPRSTVGNDHSASLHRPVLIISSPQWHILPVRQQLRPQARGIWHQVIQLSGPDQLVRTYAHTHIPSLRHAACIVLTMSQEVRGFLVRSVFRQPMQCVRWLRQTAHRLQFEEQAVRDVGERWLFRLPRCHFNISNWTFHVPQHYRIYRPKVQRPPTCGLLGRDIWRQGIFGFLCTQLP